MDAFLKQNAMALCVYQSNYQLNTMNNSIKLLECCVLYIPIHHIFLFFYISCARCLLASRLTALVAAASVAAINPSLKLSALAVVPGASSVPFESTAAAAVAGSVANRAVGEIAFVKKRSVGRRDGGGGGQGGCERGDDDGSGKHGGGRLYM